jgi:threonine dehydratase
MAVRVPVAEAFALYAKGAERIVAVSDDEVAEAMRIYYSDTHNLAEGAGAAPLAALLKEQDEMQGKEVGVILSGGNVDLHVYAAILAGKVSTLSPS